MSCIIDVRRQWDKTMLVDLVLVFFWQAIFSIFLPACSVDDSLVWILTPDGVYYVRTVALLVQGLFFLSFASKNLSFGYGIFLSPNVRLQKCRVFLPQEC